MTTPSDNDGRWYGWYDNRLYYTDGSTFVVPSGLRGDVNDDGAVSISDVTTLIDALLSGDMNSINVGNADTNLDNGVSISDATTLIDFLLGGIWPN